jgi:hypothetical protein
LIGLLVAPLVPGATSSLSDSQQPRAARVIHGYVVLPDEGSPSGLYAYLTSPSRSDSVAVDATGAFTLTVTEAHCGPLDVRVDTPPERDRRYHRAIVRLEPRRRQGLTYVATPAVDTLATLRVLLVPTRVVIEGGTHAGMLVPIQVNGAVASERERPRFWRVARSTREGFGVPVAWPEGLFPIAVSLRARGGVGSADSAAFWRTARQLEADLGRSLFQPAPDDAGPEEIWRIIVTIEPMVGSAGMTYITYDSHGGVYEATIAIRSAAYLGDTRLVTHELMHALGFGHATTWFSATNASPASPARLTPADVGHAQLLYRLRRAHVAQAATHGVLASADDSRRTFSAAASRCVP